MQALETLVLRCPTEVGAWVGGEGKVSFSFDVMLWWFGRWLEERGRGRRGERRGGRREEREGDGEWGANGRGG